MQIPYVAQAETAAIVSREVGERADGVDVLLCFKDLGAFFHAIWLETVVVPKSPHYRIPGGDPMLFVTLQF